MEATNNSNQTENYYVIEDVPSLQTIFTASMPENLIEKLDKRSIENKSKVDTFEKQAKAENYQKQKTHELFEKAQKQEEQRNLAQDYKNQGAIYQEMQQNKVKSLERKLNKAAENASLQTIVKMQKAAEHNEKVRLNKNEHLLKSSDEQKGQSGQTNDKQEKALERRDLATAQKIQSALDSQNKHKFDVEVHYQREMEQKKNQIVEKQEKAEQQRQQLKQEKLQKAKDSQQKFNRNIKSVSNERVNSKDIIETQQVARDYSVDQVEKMINSEIQNDSEVVPQQSSQNVNVSLPINFKIESHNNEQKESQQVNISQQKVMYVGGNKITFNVNIDIKVEPIDS